MTYPISIRAWRGVLDGTGSVRVDLRRADLNGANLRRVNLGDADMSGADLRRGPVAATVAGPSGRAESARLDMQGWCPARVPGSAARQRGRPRRDGTCPGGRGQQPAWARHSLGRLRGALSLECQWSGWLTTRGTLRSPTAPTGSAPGKKGVRLFVCNYGSGKAMSWVVAVRIWYSGRPAVGLEIAAAAEIVASAAEPRHWRP